MKLVAFDTETHLIRAGCLAPRMVCLSFAIPHLTGAATGVVLRDRGLELIRQWLLDPEVALVGHNLPYDLGVVCAEDPDLVPLVFDAYAAGRVRCTSTKQKLLDIALGMRKWRRYRGKVARATYGLGDLVELYFDEHLEKVDTWRLRYSELDGVPVEQWPQEAVDYAVSDAVEALRVHDAQEEAIREYFGELPNQAEQQRAAWVLHLMSMWGIRAERERVEAFERHCRAEIEKMEDALDDTGIFKVDKKTGGLKRNPNGTPQRVMKEIMARVVASLEAQGAQVPMTPPSGKFPNGQVKTDADTLLLTDDPALHVLAESMSFAKHLGQWGPVLRAAVDRPVCCRYVELVETGRTASSGSEGQEGTNIQNPPRKGDVRPAVVPRDGYLFCSTDADAIELVAHAENCLDLLGWSKTADTIVHWKQSGGPDPHEALAASIVGTVTPEALQAAVRAGDKDMEDARQFAKIPQYGFLGGLGPRVFVAYAAAQLDRAQFLKWFDVDRRKAEAKAKAIREAWFEYAPENRPYFKRIEDMMGGERLATVRQLMSGRIRGGARFTAIANGFFQGRVADAMKEILFRLGDECYTGRCTSAHRHGGSSDCTHAGRSILVGSRPVMFLHDEPILEHPENGTEGDRGWRQQAVVLEGLAKWFPRVPSGSTFVLMRRWHKGAKPIKDAPHLPVMPVKDAEGKTRWVHDPGRGEARRIAC